MHHPRSTIKKGRDAGRLWNLTPPCMWVVKKKCTTASITLSKSKGHHRSTYPKYARMQWVGMCCSSSQRTLKRQAGLESHLKVPLQRWYWLWWYQSTKMQGRIGQYQMRWNSRHCPRCLEWWRSNYTIPFESIW